MPSKRAVSRLWRWADRRNVKIEGLNDQIEVAHRDTADFVDGIHTASRVLRWVFPAAEKLDHLRHRIRGTTMDPSLQGLTMFANWNSSTSFLEGSEFAHRALLDAFWRPVGSPLPPLLEDSSHQVLRSLDSARAAAQDIPEASGEALRSDVFCASSRFVRLHGPASLAYIQKFEQESFPDIIRAIAGFGGAQDPELAAIFDRETFADTPLHLEVLAAAEARRGELSLRRLDRLSLECAFNLREGIASPFSIARWDCSLAEERQNGWDDDDDDE